MGWAVPSHQEFIPVFPTFTCVFLLEAGAKGKCKIHYKRVRERILGAVYIIYTNPPLTNTVLFMTAFVICRNFARQSFLRFSAREFPFRLLSIPTSSQAIFEADDNDDCAGQNPPTAVRGDIINVINHRRLTFQVCKRPQGNGKDENDGALGIKITLCCACVV